jgi:hypothetical protein
VKLKKKYLKSYVGRIPAYEVNLNNQIISINATEIKVSLTKDSIYVQVGTSKWEGIYSTIKLEKKNYELTGKMVGTGIPEILLLNGKAKKIIRKGLFPQPDTVMERKN